MNRSGGRLGRLRRLLTRTDAREPGRRNHVSLGCNCQTAHALKTLNLRAWSGPFDWVFSMPGMVRDCLADDFAALVDPAELETIPEAERAGPGITLGRHRLYRRRHGLDCVFNHHDPAGVRDDYAFLLAGVRRLRAALDDPAAENRLWMMTHLHTPEAVVVEVADLLARRASRTHLTFVQIVPGAPAAGLAGAVDLRSDLRWLTLGVPSHPVGLRLADPGDDAFLLRTLAEEAGRRA